jgi:hydroxymethylpyrimidine/phosphomethylpyrimidine kinase
MVVAQIRSVAADIGIDAIKIGMLGDAETAAAVAGCLLQLAADVPIVVDPVLVSTSGARLLATDALGALLSLIVPLATVLTPNLPEAEALVRAAGGEPGTGFAGVAGAAGAAGLAGAGGAVPDQAAALARALHELGPTAVVVTGGHRAGGADLFYDGAGVVEIGGPRHASRDTHGSGCTHSAVLAAQLALGLPALAAARIAREIAADAIGHGRDDIGRGDGPVDVLGGRPENRH